MVPITIIAMSICKHFVAEQVVSLAFSFSYKKKGALATQLTDRVEHI